MVQRGRQHRAGFYGRAALCIAAWASLGAGDVADEVCGGWTVGRDVAQEAGRVRLTRAGWQVVGDGLEGCAVEGEARLMGERLYVLAGRLTVSADEIEAPAGAEVMMAGQGARWRAARAVVRVSDGRVTLEGVSPVGSGAEQGVESAKEESER